MTTAVPQLRHLGIATDYAQLHELLRRRQAELGMSFETLNAISGLTYADKLLAPNPLCGPTNARTATGRLARQSGRGIGPEAWGPLLGALGMVLIAAEDPAAIARIMARSNYRKRSKTQVNDAKRLSMDALVSRRAEQKSAFYVERHMAEIGSKGGAARNTALSPALRKKIARKAARIRWRLERAGKRG